MNDVKKYLAAIGRRGGQAKTAAKSKAARLNGKRGGRPKIMAHCRQEPVEGVKDGATLDILPRMTHK